MRNLNARLRLPNLIRHLIKIAQRSPPVNLPRRQNPVRQKSRSRSEIASASGGNLQSPDKIIRRIFVQKINSTGRTISRQTKLPARRKSEAPRSNPRELLFAGLTAFASASLSLLKRRFAAPLIVHLETFATYSNSTSIL